jgi:hypothetical protein
VPGVEHRPFRFLHQCFSTPFCAPTYCSFSVALNSTYPLSGFVLLSQLKVLVQESIAVVAEGDVIAEIDDFSRGMRTGFLFFCRVKIDLRNCSLFLVRREGLFGWFWTTRVVVPGDHIDLFALYSQPFLQGREFQEFENYTDWRHDSHPPYTAKQAKIPHEAT